MNFVRALIRDLIDKKLWPIAVVLVVALVAVPVVMGGGGESASDEVTLSPLPSDEPGSTKVAAVELVGPPSVRSRAGKTRDPFRRKPVKAPGAATTSTDAPATGDTGGTGAAGGAGAPGETTTATPNTGTADAKVSHSYYRTEVRFGDDANPAAAARPLSRLAPLPDAAGPVAIYLGVSSKGAAFLLGPGATATGEGDCLDADCRIVALQQGESTLVDMTAGDGSPEHQYTLEVVAVDEVTASKTIAKRMHLRVHPEGRDVLRSLFADPGAAKALGSAVYDMESGLVVDPAPAAAKVIP